MLIYMCANRVLSDYVTEISPGVLRVENFHLALTLVAVGTLEEHLLTRDQAWSGYPSPPSCHLQFIHYTFTCIHISGEAMY